MVHWLKSATVPAEDLNLVPEPTINSLELFMTLVPRNKIPLAFEGTSLMSIYPYIHIIKKKINQG